MVIQHTVMFVDHHRAKIMPLGSKSAFTVHEHLHLARQHANVERSKHEFLNNVCDALKGLIEIQVVGGHTGVANFKDYAEKHRPETAAHIVAYEIVDQTTDSDQIALVRKRFIQVDQIRGASNCSPA